MQFVLWKTFLKMGIHVIFNYQIIDKNGKKYFPDQFLPYYWNTVHKMSSQCKILLLSPDIGNQSDIEIEDVLFLKLYRLGKKQEVSTKLHLLVVTFPNSSVRNKLIKSTNNWKISLSIRINRTVEERNLYKNKFAKKDNSWEWELPEVHLAIQKWSKSKFHHSTQLSKFICVVDKCR